MSYIFKLDFHKRIVLNRECVKLCPGLYKLPQEDLIVIILAYDYHSPYHQFPLEERLRKAIRHVYGESSKNFFERKGIIKNVELYRSLQYDYRRELVDTYRSKVYLLQKNLEDTTDNKDIGLILDSITKLHSSIERMQREIEKSDDYLDIKGGTKLSLLEKLQQNRELFYKHARTEKQISNNSVPAQVKDQYVSAQSGSR